MLEVPRGTPLSLRGAMAAGVLRQRPGFLQPPGAGHGSTYAHSGPLPPYAPRHHRDYTSTLLYAAWAAAGSMVGLPSP